MLSHVVYTDSLVTVHTGRVFSRDILKEGILPCEPEVGESSGCSIIWLLPICGHRFIKILKKPKAIVQGFFFSGSEKMC